MTESSELRGPPPAVRLSGIETDAFTSGPIETHGGRGHSADLYEITVEDPDVLLEPWVIPPRILRLNGAPEAGLVPERAYCEVYKTKDISGQARH